MIVNPSNLSSIIPVGVGLDVGDVSGYIICCWNSQEKHPDWWTEGQPPCGTRRRGGKGGGGNGAGKEEAL